MKRIQELQDREFRNIQVHFYQNPPILRGFACTQKHSPARRGFVSFYYFPSHSRSKHLPYAMFIDEAKTGKHPCLDLFHSWFEYFWGKSGKITSQLHTIIFDFDDTIVNSHDIQIEAWVEIVQEARQRYHLTPQDFQEPFREMLDQKNMLRDTIRSMFFTEQDGNVILQNMFSGLSEAQEMQIQQRRFERREKKMEAGVELFPGFKDAVRQLAHTYHLMIVSATDEEMIRSVFKNQKMGEQNNLLEYFDHTFGKKEPIFDWENVRRKSQVIIKIITILGIPLERLLYVGDSTGDFLACKHIGIDFIEARLFAEK